MIFFENKFRFCQLQQKQQFLLKLFFSQKTTKTAATKNPLKCNSGKKRCPKVSLVSKRSLACSTTDGRLRCGRVRFGVGKQFHFFSISTASDNFMQLWSRPRLQKITITVFFVSGCQVLTQRKHSNNDNSRRVATKLSQVLI